MQKHQESSFLWNSKTGNEKDYKLEWWCLDQALTYLISSFHISKIKDNDKDEYKPVWFLQLNESDCP